MKFPTKNLKRNLYQRIANKNSLPKSLDRYLYQNFFKETFVPKYPCRESPKDFWKRTSPPKTQKRNLYQKRLKRNSHKKNIYKKMTEDKSIPKNLWRKIFHQKFLKRHLHLRISEEKFSTKKTIPKGMFYQKFPEEKLSTKKSLKKSFYKNVFEEEPPPKKNKKTLPEPKHSQEKFLQTNPQRNLYPQHISQKGLYQVFFQEKSLPKKDSREISTKKIFQICLKRISLQRTFGGIPFQVFFGRDLSSDIFGWIFWFGDFFVVIFLHSFFLDFFWLEIHLQIFCGETVGFFRGWEAVRVRFFIDLWNWNITMFYHHIKIWNLAMYIFFWNALFPTVNLFRLNQLFFDIVICPQAAFFVSFQKRLKGDCSSVQFSWKSSLSLFIFKKHLSCKSLCSLCCLKWFFLK